MFSMKFAGNFSSVDAQPVSHNFSGHQFNNILHNSYRAALYVALSSFTSSKIVSGNFLPRLAVVLALSLCIIFQQSVMQGCFPCS